MSKSLAYFLLFLLPFVILPIGASEFETPKVIVAEIGIQALFLVSIFFSKIKINKTHFIFCGLLFFLTILDLVFINKSATNFFGNPFRLQGIFLFWNLLVFSLLTKTQTLENLSLKYFITPLMLLVITAIAFGSNEANRAIGTLGEPNFLAATALFFWPFILISKAKPPKTIYFIVLLSTVAILNITKSESALLGFVLQTIFLGLGIGKRKNLAILTCLAILFLSFTLPFIFDHAVYENRAEIWQAAWHSGLTNLPFGAGFGNIEKVLNIKSSYVDSSHNIFLDFFVQGGIFGLILIVIFIIRALRTASTRNIVLLLGLLSVLSFNPGGVCTLLAFWWLLGQV